MEFTQRSSGPSATIWTTDKATKVPLQEVVVDGPKTVPYERRFQPYDFNGGTVVAIAGADYAIVAGDTRISTGYEILSRQSSKLYPLTERTILTAAGCLSDIVTLKKVLDVRLAQYQHSEETAMPTSAVAQLLSTTLYSRRFFPYYAFCMVAGLDAEGKGAVYGYDAVGSFKRDDYGCMGSGQNFLWPLLDNLVGHKNRLDERRALSKEEAVALVKELFVVATERDIYTGDAVEISVVTSLGIHTEVFPLKKD